MDLLPLPILQPSQQSTPSLGWVSSIVHMIALQVLVANLTDNESLVFGRHLVNDGEVMNVQINILRLLLKPPDNVFQLLADK